MTRRQRWTEIAKRLGELENVVEKVSQTLHHPDQRLAFDIMSYGKLTCACSMAGYAMDGDAGIDPPGPRRLCREYWDETNGDFDGIRDKEIHAAATRVRKALRGDFK